MWEWKCVYRILEQFETVRTACSFDLLVYFYFYIFYIFIFIYCQDDY